MSFWHGHLFSRKQFANKGESLTMARQIIDDGTFFEIDGTLGNDYIAGSSIDNDIDGLEGDDVVLGGAGFDTITTGDGNDTVLGNEDDDTISLGDSLGALAREGFAGPSDVAYGGEGNDTIFGENGIDYLFGQLGDDILDGGSGDDIVLGDDDRPAIAGADNLTGGFGSDFVSGGEGDDFINSHSSRVNDRVIEKDELFGGLGADTFNLFANYLGGRASGSPALERRFSDGSFAVLRDFRLGEGDTLNLLSPATRYQFLRGSFDGRGAADTFVVTRSNGVLNTVAVVLNTSNTALSGVVGQVP
jgi:Ca2+-binding RTX toxin-like protein